MRLDVWNDLHLDSIIEILRDEALAAEADPNTIFNGDIWDMQRTLKRNLLRTRTSKIAFKIKHGENYIPGNHDPDEIDPLKNFFVIKVSSDTGKRIGFFHSDLEANPEKWGKYRGKPPGCGIFKYYIWTRFVDVAEKIIDRKLKREFVTNVLKVMDEHELDIYVGAHFHPDEIVKHETIYKGKLRTIMVMPRGHHVLYL